MLAVEVPQTTAALLQLDFAQRTAGPLPRALRSAMRWVSAHANGCDYAVACAAADARRAGVHESRLETLSRDGYPGWPAAERAALEFAQKMTVDSDAVTDAEFAGLVGHFGEHQTAAMVLLLAYANFQDRLLLCLGATIEPGGPLPPLDATFGPEAFVVKTTPPPPRPEARVAHPAAQNLIAHDRPERAPTYAALQGRLEEQRQKPTRLGVPAWAEVVPKLPEGLLREHNAIVWYRIVFGYAPELAVPFEIFMRTLSAESAPRWNRDFGGSLFWLTTRAVQCPYCMGHCEMNWEVAGLTAVEIAERSRRLADDDWSDFAPAEQRAFAFAQKLAATPGKISRNDVAELQQGFGSDRAIIVMLHASRYHYMTRISNGFQLTLERENVFYDYYHVAPTAAGTSRVDAASIPLLSDAACWQRLPQALSGGGQPLPNWVRGVAAHLPRTAAAMLQLDYAHRVKSPLDPVLRGKMRWVVARANRCAYSEAYALADLKRANLDDTALSALTGGDSTWRPADRDPLEFARLLSTAAPTIPDALFEAIRQQYGEKQVAAMILLAAYGNFQDRIVLGLNLPLEAAGPLAPLDVAFVPDAFQLAPLMPAQSRVTPLAESGETVVPEDHEWPALSYDELQSQLEQQRHRSPRLPVPTWEEVQKNLPLAMAARPTRIVWNLVCAGYVPELAVPWSISTRTLWAESKPDRVFEESLFWIQTRSVGCNYCMGHCEMLLEVAGLDRQAIAERTRRLASSDWSAFSPAEQRAYAYARTLSKTPWALTPRDYATLEADWSGAKAMATFWWLCRGLYMTRVSDGFQLPLEHENVFMDPSQPGPTASRTAPGIKSI